MIVSHKYKFIFIKTHKTAGSSLEMALGALCGDDDIVTHMETNLNSGIPRNFAETTAISNLYNRSRWARKLISKHSPILGNYFYEHMPAWRVKALVGEEVWNSYYKFCFERNPWDKVVSYYLWKTHGQSRNLPDFHDYVINKPHRLPVDSKLYCDGDALILDHIYEFRELPAAIQDLNNVLGIQLGSVLPKEKTGIMPNRKHYQEFYDDETRTKVTQLFYKEIKLMNYSF